MNGAHRIRGWQSSWRTRRLPLRSWSRERVYSCTTCGHKLGVLAKGVEYDGAECYRCCGGVYTRTE